jgi:DnaJ-class molecular chaperone
MRIDDAFCALGLVPGASPSAVRASYRALATKAHPDIPGGSAEAFEALSEARNIALGFAETEPCPTCNGTGQETTTHGFFAVKVTCSVCKGSGKAHDR